MTRLRWFNILIFLGLAAILEIAGNACSHNSTTITPVSAPGITFSPLGGPVTGGNVLTLNGSFSDQNMSITMAGVDCPVTSFSTSLVTCTVPSSSAAWAPVAITVPSQNPVTLTQTYAYGASVVGQPNFNTGSLNYTNSLSQPSYALPLTSGNLFIADSQASRVTIYAPAPAQSSLAPTGVLGQADTSGDFLQFTDSSVYGLTFSSPKSMCNNGSGVIIADTGRNRLLIYNNEPTGPTQPPDFVLGQTDLVGQLPNQGSLFVDGTMLDNPEGVYCDTNSNIIVADTGNNRVLIWNTAITANGQAANLVLGQSSFNSSTANFVGTGTTSPTASNMTGPRAVLYDGTEFLYVADSGNQRVLIFDEGGGLPAADFVAAAHVLGPTSANSAAGRGCILGGLTNPAGLVFLNGYLYVSDSSKNRIQAWNTSDLSGIPNWPIGGQPADLVFGQTSSTSCAANQGTSPATLLTLREPTGLSSDGTSSLYVADTGNNRVLEYLAAPTTDSPLPTPDIYLGQISPSGVSPAYSVLSSSALRAPQNAAILGGKLYVADPDFNRVMMYSTVPTLPGAAASLVIGQPDMVSGIPNLVTGSISAQTLSAPKGIFMDTSQNVYVSDAGNNRVLLFSGAPTSNDQTATTVLGQSGMTTATAPTTATATSLQGSSGSCIAGTQLFVVDTGNNRVLVYSSWNPSGGNDPTASFAIGQTGLTANSANQGGAVGPTTLWSPSFIACGTSKLVVSDTDNQRVLVYSLPITANAPTPTLVLGQTSFATNSANLGNSSASGGSVYNPHGVAIDGNHLYVADGHNNRILVWHTFPTLNGQQADMQFGQTSATNSLPNGGGATPTMTTLAGPEGLSISSGLLVISDAGNNRVLILPEP